MTKLDYSLTEDAEKKILVEKILEENPDITNYYLEVLAGYLANNEQTKKERTIISDNRMKTITTRETSLESLTNTLKGGEDTLYNLITNDKNVIFRHKVQITEEDIEKVPGLKELREAIDTWEAHSTGFKAKREAIDMRKLQYDLKQAYLCPRAAKKKIKGENLTELEGEIFLVNDELVSRGVCFTDPKTVSLILNNYSNLKAQGYEDVQSSVFYFMIAFDELCGEAIPAGSYYESIIIGKIDKMTNEAIQEMLQEKHDIYHSCDYISSLWTNKIPTVIANKAKEQWLRWKWSQTPNAEWQTCSRCDESKPAHNFFFSRNSTSRNGFYSICKECRSTRNKR